jgi:hypothetical protein
MSTSDKRSRRLTFRVSDYMIRKARRLIKTGRVSEHCPISCALNHALKTDDVVSSANFISCGSKKLWMRSTKKIAKFINKFDETGKAKPCSFTILIPQE